LRISRMESALLSEYNLEANIFKEYNENTKCVAAMAFSEGEAKGKAEGEAKGKAEGKAEANMVLARNLKDVTGMSMEDIYKVVDLTEEQKGELFPGNV
jgi:flagellar biosynthesis/type III secretory pathway protein FliH